MREYLKHGVAVVGLTAFGLWLGMNYVAIRAYEAQGPLYRAPWHSDVQELVLLSVVVMGLSAIGWMWFDYTNMEDNNE